MKTCSMCGLVADVDWLGRCEPCFRIYVDNVKDNPYPTTKRCYTGNHKGAISPAHADDIKRRMVGPDGEVFRDRGRKSFMVK